jgi:predicted RecB family nuclease
MGILIVENRVERHIALWADRAEHEQQMFQEFLTVLGQYNAYCLFYYGSYESSFLRRMRKHARRKTPVDHVIQKSLNVLSCLHSTIYFPTYTNGLKEIGRFLGCTWSDVDASGLQSLLWRAQWEKTLDEQWKRRLIQYNSEDCRALRRITEILYLLCTQDSSVPVPATSGQQLPPSTLVQDLVPYSSRPEWRAQQFSSADFAYINRCAYFDYQQEKVRLRSTQKRHRRRTSQLYKHAPKHDRRNTGSQVPTMWEHSDYS